MPGVESATLAELFGKKYRRYAEAVPLFFPRFPAYRVGANAKFDVSLYKRYRDASNIEFSPFALKQNFVYNARQSRERRVR